MKTILIAFGTLITLVACNDDAGSSSHGSASGDSSGAAGQQAHKHATGNSSAGSDKTMMGLMHANMAQMAALPSSGDPDRDFAGLMRIHHIGAVEMAQLELAQGSDTLIRSMARKMLDAQQNEVSLFGRFLAEHQAQGGGDAFYKKAIGDMDHMKMNMDQSGSIDKQFVEMMIPHHQGGIDMATAYLQNGARVAGLKRMANNIIADQAKEIKEMKQWLFKH